MGLGRQVVDFVRLHGLNDPDQVGGVGHVAIVQDQPAPLYMGVLIEVVNPVGVEQGGAPLDAMHLIPLLKQ